MSPDGTVSAGSPARRAELETGLARVRERITSAADAAGRAPADITLVVVTKFFPASDVETLRDLGVREVGENRHQEAQAKIAELRARRGDPDSTDLEAGGLRWHYIGGLQSNKAVAVAGYADVVESLDRAKLIAPLGRGAAERGTALDVLLQVNLDPPGVTAARAGARAEVVPDLAAAVAANEHLRLRGLMAVAPLGLDPEPGFAQLAELSRALIAEHPAAVWISAGMSGDLEQAIKHGATHVRVGSAVLGPRPVVQ